MGNAGPGDASEAAPPSPRALLTRLDALCRRRPATDDSGDRSGFFFFFKGGALFTRCHGNPSFRDAELLPASVRRRRVGDWCVSPLALALTWLEPPRGHDHVDSVGFGPKPLFFLHITEEAAKKTNKQNKQRKAFARRKKGADQPSHGSAHANLLTGFWFIGLPPGSTFPYATKTKTQIIVHQSRPYKGAESR